MKVNLYTIYDSVAEEAGPIFEAKNDGTARRSFHQLTNNAQFKGDPDEYTIILLGSYDKEMAKIEALKVTKVIDKHYGTAEDEENES